ncbi:MAG: transposase [Deltaproteobacteria bacterium]|nr:MAG: transposase [Deltaproteobacteria bacterium]
MVLDRKGLYQLFLAASLAQRFICPVCHGRKGWQMRTGLIRCTACQYKVPTISP